MTEEEKSARARRYGSADREVVASEPEGIVLPAMFRELGEKIYQMDLRQDDVWVITYPKVGTTWTQEMVWQVAHGFDPEGGKAKLGQRFPFLVTNR